jgi:hypothetical protein
VFPESAAIALPMQRHGLSASLDVLNDLAAKGDIIRPEHLSTVTQGFFASLDVLNDLPTIRGASFFYA